MPESLNNTPTATPRTLANVNSDIAVVVSKLVHVCAELFGLLSVLLDEHVEAATSLASPGAAAAD